MKAVGGGTRRLGLIGVTVLALIVALAASLRFVAASRSRDKFDSVIAHSWAGARCARPSSLSKIIETIPKILNQATLATIFGRGPLTQAYLDRLSFGLFDSNRFTDPSVTAISSAVPTWGPGINLLRYDHLLIGFYGNGSGNSAALTWDPGTDEIITVVSNSGSAIGPDIELIQSLRQKTSG